jgi:hypothetical protein|nr:MAG TPA: Prominin [Caudoviricetes sp.]
MKGLIMFIYIALIVTVIALAIVSVMLFFACCRCEMQADVITELQARNQSLCNHFAVAHDLVMSGSVCRAKYIDDVLYEISMYED